MFNYLDSKQKSEVVSNDTITVYGGQLEIDFASKWKIESFTGTTNGTVSGMF